MATDQSYTKHTHKQSTADPLSKCMQVDLWHCCLNTRFSACFGAFLESQKSQSLHTLLKSVASACSQMRFFFNFKGMARYLQHIVTMSCSWPSNSIGLHFSADPYWESLLQLRPACGSTVAALCSQYAQFLVLLKYNIRACNLHPSVFGLLVCSVWSHLVDFCSAKLWSWILLWQQSFIWIFKELWPLTCDGLTQ